MRRLLKTSAFKAFAFCLAMLMLGSLLSFVLHSGASPITSALSFAATPVQSICAELANAASDFLGYFRSSHVLQSKIDAQESELARLRERITDYDAAQKKLALYEEFLELKKEHPDHKYAEASIIGIDPAGNYGALTLNRGTLSGISVQDPVLYGKYLVGLVVKTEPTSCTVQTLLNPDVHVSVYETITQEVGVCGTTVALAETSMLQIAQLDRSTAITVGGLINTSGLGGIYPKDLIIGTVREIQGDSKIVSAVAIVEPAVDFASLRDVFVLTSFS
ncbi:MAG: rod shape-determining protein MreC [Oscillospiraceae bacterium]|nr:rod shape-determining protein MreC [Oscillospiraceae bacterium]